MDLTVHIAHASNISLLGIGAWPDEIPPSAYTTSLQIMNSDTDHRTANVGCDNLKNQTPEHSDAKQTTRSISNRTNHKPQACFQLKHQHPHVPESESGPLTPMQMWLRETAREEAWQVIEVTPEVLSAEIKAPFRKNYNAGVSEAGAVYGGSYCSGRRTEI
jgi:hypothetical protein